MKRLILAAAFLAPLSAHAQPVAVTVPYAVLNALAAHLQKEEPVQLLNALQKAVEDQMKADAAKAAPAPAEPTK
jgi:hypothetical protein